jgi:hypothetical protein
MIESCNRRHRLQLSVPKLIRLKEMKTVYFIDTVLDIGSTKRWGVRSRRRGLTRKSDTAGDLFGSDANSDTFGSDYNSDSCDKSNDDQMKSPDNTFYL